MNIVDDLGGSMNYKESIANCYISTLRLWEGEDSADEEYEVEGDGVPADVVLAEEVAAGRVQDDRQHRRNAWLKKTKVRMILSCYDDALQNICGREKEEEEVSLNVMNHIDFFKSYFKSQLFRIFMTQL